MFVNDKYDYYPLFVEWAHTHHYSVTTSKQCTILANELKRKYGGKHEIVTREIGMNSLDMLKKSTAHNYAMLHVNERNK